MDAVAVLEVDVEARAAVAADAGEAAEVVSEVSRDLARGAWVAVAVLPRSAIA
jgi:hypothetical protein